MPHFYLRRFADERHLIVSHDRQEGTDALVSPKSASVISDFYTIDIGAGPSDEIEGRLSQIERVTAEALRRIDGGTFPPSEADRGALASFMALQHVRGPEFRAMQDGTATQMMQMISKVSASKPEYVREMWRKANGVDPSPEELERILASLAEGEVTVTYPREHHIGAMLQMASDMFRYFFMRRWCLLEGHDIVTNDAPVILWTRPEQRRWGVGVMTADEIVMPISPTHAILLRQPMIKDAEGIILPNPAANEALRSRMRQFAQRYTYRHPTSTLPPVDDLATPLAPLYTY